VSDFTLEELKELGMGYPQDLEDFQTYQLEQELAERKRRHAAGICSYCRRDRNTPACKFPRRHRGDEV